MTAKATITDLLPTHASIAHIVGAQPPIMPGESSQEYEQGVQSLINELQAETPMQVYMAQKMFDCIWWIRQYEILKRGIILNEMFDVLTSADRWSGKSQLALLEYLRAGDWANAKLKLAMKNADHTPESLYAKAVEHCLQKLQHLEQLIALRAKTLTQFQASFEALVNRPILQERLRMQNELLARDLSAIEVKTAMS